jgi:hypothetical protein
VKARRAKKARAAPRPAPVSESERQIDEFWACAGSLYLLDLADRVRMDYRSSLDWYERMAVARLIEREGGRPKGRAARALRRATAIGEYVTRLTTIKDLDRKTMKEEAAVEKAMKYFDVAESTVWSALRAHKKAAPAMPYLEKARRKIQELAKQDVAEFRARARQKQSRASAPDRVPSRGSD